MILYELFNKITKMGYVGITTRPIKMRFVHEHLASLRANRHGNIYLQNAFNKYGESAFECIIRNTYETIDDLNKAEQEVLILEKHRLYNLAPGGNSYNHSIEAKEKISKSQLKPVVGMNIKTGEIREYPFVMDVTRDGFDYKAIGGACKLRTSTNRNGTFTNLSAKGWVWMYKKDFNIEEMERRRKLAFRGKIRLERPVLGKHLVTGEIVSFPSTEKAKAAIGVVGIYQACQYVRVKSRGGYVWVYADLDNPQSLLEERYNAYISNPPKTGPKAWLFRGGKI
jgi:hypothetical protein